MILQMRTRELVGHTSITTFRCRVQLGDKECFCLVASSQNCLNGDLGAGLFSLLVSGALVPSYRVSSVTLLVQGIKYII
jgi:hypothetical protein